MSTVLHFLYLGATFWERPTQGRQQARRQRSLGRRFLAKVEGQKLAREPATVAPAMQGQEASWTKRRD